MVTALASRVSSMVRNVTPEDARAWLDTNVRTHGRGDRFIRAYARDMAAGRWRLNGETIIFSSSGRLLDGRKRLLACIESGVSFPTIIVENVDEENFKTIDALRPRTAADTLYIQREPHHQTLSFVLNLTDRYYRYHQHSIPVTRALPARDALFLLDVRPEIRESVADTVGFARLGGRTVAAVVHHLASRVDPTRAHNFFDRVLNGPENDNDPAILLRKAFENSKGSGQERMLALTIRAWNAEYQNRPLRYLRWRQEGQSPEKFPTIVDLPLDDGADLDREWLPAHDIVVDPRDLQVAVELITPQVAEALLTDKEHNRKIVMRVVEKYARDLHAGNWTLNGQTIKISKSGRLLDGQHRCAASVKAGTAFQAVVVRGLPDEVFDTLNAGQVRHLGEVLAAQGEKNTSALAAALQKLWLYEQEIPTLHTLRGSHAELLRVLERHAGIRDSLQYCLSRLREVLPGAIGATTHYLGTSYDRERADWFVKRVGDGIQLNEYDPIRLLRELMLRDRRNKRGSLREVEKWALTIKAMNAFFEGREVRLLVWRPRANEGFPRVLERRNKSRVEAPEQVVIPELMASGVV